MGRQKPRRAALMTIGLALLLYRRAKTKPAEYTATALGLDTFFIDVLKLNPRSTPRQRKGRLGRIATTVVALLHKKLPRVRPESGPPPPPPALRVRGWKQSKQRQPRGHRCTPSTGQPAASVSTVSTINSGEAAQRPPVRNSPPTHLL